MNEYDKINDNVVFREKDHKYFNIKDPSIQYTSVTTLIESFGQEFNSEFWSFYKALEKLLPKEAWSIEKKSLLATKRINKKLLEIYNISDNEFNKVQQDILDEWQKENIESCKRGTAIHAGLEQAMYNNPNAQMKKFGYGGKFICKKDHTELDLTNGIYPEYLVYYSDPDNIIHLAGQIDVLIIGEGTISIADYKTNKKIDLKSGFNTATRTTAKMKYPLNTLDDCNYSHYSLQLSLYAWMINKWHPEWTVDSLKLIHFDHRDKMTVYDIEYKKKEVELMLRYFKKQKIIEAQRAKREPIIY